MILTRQQKLFRGNGSAPNARAIADGVITALSPAAWYRNATDVVSSGGFASIWADYASSDKGLVLPGVAGNYASAPDSVPLSITGDIDIRVRVALDDWTPSSAMSVFSKADSNTTRSYYLTVNATAGTLVLASSPDGTAGSQVSGTSSAAPTVNDREAIWIRVTLDVDDGAGNRVYKFYTAADSDSEPSSWTQLGITQTVAGATSIHDNSSVVEVGSVLAGTTQVTAGRIYRAIIKSGIDGTTVFDADFSAQAIGAGSFTESSSNAATVTINASGAAPAHIGKARDLLQGTGTNQPAYAAGVFTFDGADNFMAVSYTANQPRTIYLVGKQVTWADSDHLINGVTANVAVYQHVITPRLAIYAGSSVADNTNLAVNTMGIICTVFNGASSSLRINNTAKTTGNAGAANPGGLTLAALNTGLGNHANIAVYEAIDFAAAHSDAEQDSVITALANALSVTV